MKITREHLHKAYNRGWEGAECWPRSFCDRLRAAWFVLLGKQPIHRRFKIRGLPMLEPFEFSRPTLVIMDDLEDEA